MNVLERLLDGWWRRRQSPVPSRFDPSAVSFGACMGPVLYGFFVWLRAARLEVPPVGAQPEQVTAA